MKSIPYFNYRQWDIAEDLIITDAPTLFPIENAEQYESSVFCVNTANGIFFQKERGDTYDIVSVTKMGQETVMKNTFVVAADLKYSCFIVYNEITQKNYIIDTRGEFFILPPVKKQLFLGPAQYHFKLDFTTGRYTIGNKDTILWEIKAISDEHVLQFANEIRADCSLLLNPNFKPFFRKKYFLKKQGKTKYLYFTLSTNKQGKIVEWLVSQGLPYEIVPNIFLDDDTLNIRIEVNQENAARRDFQFLIAKYSSTYAIFGVPIIKLLAALGVPYSEKHKYNLYFPSLSESELKICLKIINSLKKRYWAINNYQIYRRVFKPILQQLYTGHKFDPDNEFEAIIYSEDDTVTFKMRHSARRMKLREYESSIIAEMTQNGIKFSRWVNETKMFELIYKHYPDAIYQYRASWLEKQTLDVFVPSIRVGFEYQGIQHFKPVDYFGGDSGFVYTRVRDDRKKTLCKHHGIKIVYWNYDEPINELMLRQKLDNIL